MSKEYLEKFKDPRWQKKRLEILSRDNWTCQACGDKETQLHVHHKWYIENVNPWDYPDICLVTLCDDCHEIEHECKYEHYNLLAYSLLSHGYFNIDLHEFACAISSTPKDKLESFFGIRKRLKVE